MASVQQTSAAIVRILQGGLTQAEIARRFARRLVPALVSLDEKARACFGPPT